MIKVYWDNINNIWDSHLLKKGVKINKESFWFVLNNNYSFNDCLLNKEYEYTFDFYDNKEIVLTSAINIENEIELTNLHLHMASLSIGLK